MKLIKTLTAIIIAHTLLSSSCSKKDDVVNLGNGNISGSWKVSLYWDKVDETNKVAGYTFSFNGGGQVVATKGGVNVNGTWSENSSDFQLNFGADPVLSDLNGSWLKVEKTNTSIKLKDDNPAQDDKLNFVKL